MMGSLLGATLWDSMYNSVLRLSFALGSQIFGFAADVALVVMGKNLVVLERTCNAAINVVKSWIASVGLKIAEHKTDVLLVSRRKNMEYITITVGDQMITSKQSIE